VRSSFEGSNPDPATILWLALVSDGFVIYKVRAFTVDREAIELAHGHGRIIGR